MGSERQQRESRWSRRHGFLLAAIVLLGLGPRLLLCLYNTSANDAHMEVVRIILETDRLPLVDDCWQCYQPKLFHQVTAAAIRASGIERPRRQLVLAQLLNFVAAAGTLWVVWRMARRLAAPPEVLLLAFALIALNPRFNGISAQATNDSFVIFLGSVTIYSLWRFLEGAGRFALASAIVGLVLMSLAKTQGLVFFAMIVTILGVKIAVPGGEPGMRRRLAGALAATVLCYAATVPFLGPYWAHYRLKGDPMAANMERVPPPGWFEHSLYRRPGVRSLADGYLTFRIFDLLRQPYVTMGACRLRTAAGDELYDPRCAAHRTSFWSQLYGRFQFVQFVSYPRPWGTRDPRILDTGRALLVLGLLPLAILLYGVALETRDFVGGLAREGPAWLARDNRWVLLALLGGALLIVAQLEYLMRDFSSMKVIYAFPAFVCFLAVFVRGLSAVTARLAQRRGWLFALYGVHAVLLALYVLDVAWLIGQLH